MNRQQATVLILDECLASVCPETGRIVARRFTGKRVTVVRCEHCGEWERVDGNYCTRTGAGRRAPLGIGETG